MNKLEKTELNRTIGKLLDWGIVSFSVNQTIYTTEEEVIYKGVEKSLKEKSGKVSIRAKVENTDFPKGWTSITDVNYKKYINPGWNSLAMRMGATTKGEVILGIDVDSIPDNKSAEELREFFKMEYDMDPYCKTKNGGYHFLLKTGDKFFEKFSSKDGYLKFDGKMYKVDLKCNNQVLFTYPTELVHEDKTFKYELVENDFEYEIPSCKKLERNLKEQIMQSKKNKNKEIIKKKSIESDDEDEVIESDEDDEVVESDEDDEVVESEEKSKDEDEDGDNSSDEGSKKELRRDQFKHKKDRIKFILKHVSDKRSDTRIEWLSAGYMVKNELGKAGYSLWRSFSRKSGKYKLSDKELRKHWDGFKKKVYGLATLTTGVYWLREDNPKKYEEYICLFSGLRMGDVFNLNYFHGLSNMDKYIYFNHYHCMILNPHEYIKLEYKNGLVSNTSSFKSTSNLQDTYASLTLNNTRKGEDVNFIRAWVRNRYKKIYSSMDYRPKSSKESKNNDIIEKDSRTGDYIYKFNKASTAEILYQKYEELTDDEKESYKMIDKLFSELCNNEKKVKKYVKNWISHLLQNPGDKPGVSLIYLSILGGIGKNLFWQEFLGRKILGENLYNHALNLGEMTNRFNTGMAYKLLTVCDEVVKPKNEEMNYIKALITSNQFNYEEKGQKRISIGDYNRYVFITNNINSMRIERGDRRFVCIESSASLKNNNEFFIKFRKDVLGNARILRYYYEYMLNRDISDFDVRKIPNTIYKEELEEMNRSVYMKSLESNYKNYAGKFVSYVDLYKDVESYCLDHGDRTYKDKLLMVKEYASYDKLMKKDRQGKSSDRGFRFESLEILDEYFNR